MIEIKKPNTAKVEAFLRGMNEFSEARIHIEYLLAIVNLQHVMAVFLWLMMRRMAEQRAKQYPCEGRTGRGS